MAKNEKTPIFRDQFLKGSVILDEVWSEFEKVKRVDVIIGCSIKRIAKLQEHMAKLEISKRGPSTDKYVFAKISLDQAKRIDKHNDISDPERIVWRVWLDRDIKVYASTRIEISEKTIKVDAARRLFDKAGEDIHWAVIDTGVRITHAMVKKNCKSDYQCDYTNTVRGDENGHGTHVAGIICSIAPKVTIHDYKVLDKDGSGKHSSIIQAMYDIRKANMENKEAPIHGVNLSLGGATDLGYGCGASPICEEANRLMLSGVIVCVAAGNDGFKNLLTASSTNQVEIFSSYLDLNISDPGNAQEVITVGSVHSTKPHTHGISFFSSKGPTGDGRKKPDVVAPGESIVSAYHKSDDSTAEMSGTSQATPHVSGALAIFLSVKPEFKNRAKEVKQILMKSCIDLGRDNYFQGSGMVDILKAIQSI